jgi:uncharacterized protein
LKAADWAVVLLAGALAGCASSSPRTSFYTLEAQPHSSVGSSADAAAGGAVKVSIAQVAIPDMVDRSQMVVRTAPNRVDIADFHRWAEPLRIGIARVLAEDLALQLGKGFVVVPGQAPGVTPDVRVTLDFQKLDAVLGHAVVVDALWAVRGPKGEPRAGRSLLEEPVGAADHAAIAAAYSRALARVAKDIGGAMQNSTSPEASTGSGSR